MNEWTPENVFWLILSLAIAYIFIRRMFYE